jgi:tetratricopeptide (TPR) repeat protein
MDLFDQAVACSGTGGCPAAEVSRAKALEMLGDLDRARTELVRLSEAEGEAGVAALLELVSFERNRGRDDAAKAVLERALQRGGSAEQQMILQIQRAELASRAGQSAEALAALDRAHTLSASASKQTRMRVWADSGNVLIRIDRPAEAKPLLQRALPAAEELGDQAIAVNCMLNLSLGCDSLGESAAALRWAERAVERASIVGADRQHVFSMLHLAMLHLDALRLDDAEVILARIGESLDRLDSDEARYIHCAREAEVAIVRGQFDRALDAAERGLAIVRDHPRSRANFLILRAQAHLGLGRQEAAYEESSRARAELTALGVASDAEEALAVAVRALRALGRDGPELGELRSLAEPLTFPAALEQLLAAADDEERRRSAEAANRLATHARWRAELAAVPPARS